MQSSIFVLLMLLLTFSFYSSDMNLLHVNGYALINDKQCDPGTRSVLPYSGVRFFKKNKLDLKSFKFSSGIVISVCQNGKGFFSIIDELHKNEVNVNWNSTLCFKVNKLNQTVFQMFLNNAIGSVVQAVKNGKGMHVRQMIDFTDLPNSPDNNTINYQFEPGRFSDNVHNDLIESNMKCFKIARNKQYHQRQISVFKPYSLIGGIFQCHLDQKTSSKLSNAFQAREKQNIQKKVSTFEHGQSKGSKVIDIIELKNFDCLTNIPVAPLYSENMYHQWFTAKLIPEWSLEYTIPFLYTPNDNNLLFGSNQGLRKAMDSLSGAFPKGQKNKTRLKTWYDDININEIYTSKSSLSHGNSVPISTSITQALNRLNNLLLNTSNTVRAKKFGAQDERLVTSLFNKFYNSVSLEKDVVSNKQHGNKKSKKANVRNSKNKDLEIVETRKEEKKKYITVKAFAKLYENLPLTDKIMFLVGGLQKRSILGINLGRVWELFVAD